MPQQVSLHDQPKDIWLEIFSYLKTQKKLATTCRLFNNYLMDDAFWKKCILEDFPEVDKAKLTTQLQDHSAKVLYKNLYLHKNSQALTYVIWIPGLHSETDIIHLLNTVYKLRNLNRSILCSDIENAHLLEKVTHTFTTQIPVYVLGLNLPKADFIQYHHQFSDNRYLCKVIDLRTHIVQILKKENPLSSRSKFIDQTFIKFVDNQFIAVDSVQCSEKFTMCLKK